MHTLTFATPTQLTTLQALSAPLTTADRYYGMADEKKVAVPSSTETIPALAWSDCTNHG